MRALVVVLVMAAASLAGAEDQIQRLTVPLGGSKVFRLSGPVTVGTCDDTSVVKVEEAGDGIRLVGLKEGTTLCGFSGNLAVGKRTVVEVTVKAEPKEGQ